MKESSTLQLSFCHKIWVILDFTQTTRGVWALLTAPTGITALTCFLKAREGRRGGEAPGLGTEPATSRTRGELYLCSTSLPELVRALDIESIATKVITIDQYVDQYEYPKVFRSFKK